MQIELKFECTGCSWIKSCFNLLAEDQQANWFFFFFFGKSGRPLNQLPNQLAMELRGIRGIVGGQDTKCQGLGFGYPVTGIPTSSVITAVQQQDYSASVWLRRRDKLEHVSSDTGDEVLDTAERRVKS